MRHNLNLTSNFHQPLQSLAVADIQQRLTRSCFTIDKLGKGKEKFHGHPYKPGMLNDLANSFITRFKRLGELSDLEDAILIVDSPCAILGSFKSSSGSD
ncbi:hypothetical protein JVT61DRAFT_8563 [Boletus reticuloceps]|uniref:Uncharacterized protein n=1 Tax=Boletus reticuloceps TaxID=495285 RepID=A0A8I2YYR8_9AGAM|nr:hypothetical protein JVT61DRAFT_8563 [Boletus reticuloceps]